MNNTINYASLTHDQWRTLFDNAMKEQIQSLLMNKEAITALINEDTKNASSFNYPSINALFNAVDRFKITDIRYYQLFTSGYVAQILDQRLTSTGSYGKWDYEEKKYELLIRLPSNIKWILGTEKYVDILSKTDNSTVRAVTINTNSEVQKSIFSHLKRKYAEAKRIAEAKEKHLTAVEATAQRFRERGDKDKYRQLREHLKTLQSEYSETKSEIANLERKADTIIKNTKDDDVRHMSLDTKGSEQSLQQAPKEATNAPDPEKTFDIERAAWHAREALANISQREYINEHWREMDREELYDSAGEIYQDILHLPDNVALTLVKNIDRNKLDEERNAMYNGMMYETPPYKRDPYPDLFNYLDSQITKEAENILLDDDAEKEMFAADAKDTVEEASNILENSEQIKQSFSKETTELLNQAEAIVNQTEITSERKPTATKETQYPPKTQELLDEAQKIIEQYEQHEPPEKNSIDQNLEGYTIVEQSINNNPTLNQEQKQALRDALWNSFDNYVEQNPEQENSRTL